jgi:hydroxymethylglutaryl-CoA lyase
MSDNVLVREVGLRDGLQMIGTFMPTEAKRRWVDGCWAAGFVELEACSFVPTKYIPQFADAAAVVAHARSKPGLVPATLVPNLKGAERALEAGAGKLVCIISATESFSEANLRRSKQRSLDELAAIVRLRDEFAAGRERVPIQVGVSVAFGCPFEGTVDNKQVCTAAIAAMRLGADEISLADTAGLGNPAQVRRIFASVRRELPHVTLSGHFHDTRGLGLANTFAALEEGVRAFDASLGGLGGCPNSPGATGNVATEDLVFMLESMGLNTGIDLPRLLELREFLCETLPDVRMFGHLSGTGLPKGFQPARLGSCAAGVPA